MIEITVWDVGQGNNLLLDFGRGALGIIDFGGASLAQSKRIVDIVAERAVRKPETRILFLLLTHLDQDHVSGLHELLSSPVLASRIECLICNDVLLRRWRRYLRSLMKRTPGVSMNLESSMLAKSLKSLSEFIAKKGPNGDCEHFEVVAPCLSSDQVPVPLQALKLPEGVEILFWGPHQDLKDEGLSSLGRREDAMAVGDGVREWLIRDDTDWNATSIVAEIRYGGKSVLFPGDANAKTWEKVLSTGNSPSPDALIAWHHGARLGAHNGKDYDQIVWSEILDRDVEVPVVVSAGCGNSYGHPHQDTLSRASFGGGALYCTQFRKDSPELFGSDDLGLLGIDSEEPARVISHTGNQCHGSLRVRLHPNGEVEVDSDHSPTDSAVGKDRCCRFTGSFSGGRG